MITWGENKYMLTSKLIEDSKSARPRPPHTVPRPGRPSRADGSRRVHPLAKTSSPARRQPA